MSYDYLANSPEAKSLKNAEWHGFGHDDLNTNLSLVTSMIAASALVIFSVLYMMYRVYKIEKYFSPSWIKEFEDRSIVYIDDKG